jgi:hypothetical protein
LVLLGKTFDSRGDFFSVSPAKGVWLGYYEGKVKVLFYAFQEGNTDMRGSKKDYITTRHFV